MHAGSLMIFNGRTSLHKVTPIEGHTLRIVALLAYDTKSGTDSSDELKLSRYGRLPQ
jgi:predicted 2-oxoglutarate/Fe(II)-dependent dioxygenase YbiX